MIKRHLGAVSPSTGDPAGPIHRGHRPLCGADGAGDSAKLVATSWTATEQHGVKGQGEPRVSRERAFLLDLPSLAGHW